MSSSSDYHFTSFPYLGLGDKSSTCLRRASRMKAIVFEISKKNAEKK